MAADGVDVILGIHRDDSFGPMLMLGLGGIHVEVLKDVIFAPVPIQADEARRLIRRLKAAPILDGQRGAAPADVDALIDVIVRLSQFAADFAGEIDEIDLNPIRVHPQGEGVSLLDALIIQRRSL
jgi:acyl-CoA synthetase (NDP forming)